MCPSNGIADIAVHPVQAGVVVDRPDYRITAASGVHPLDAHGYRIETRDGRALVLTGDTTYCGSIVELARGAHTIVHECHLADGHRKRRPGGVLPDDPLDAAAGRADGARCRRAAPRARPPAAERGYRAVIGQAGSVFDGEVLIGEDLMELKV